jgi:N-methylhydantoinase A
MGGTSTDVALIHGREPRKSHDNQIDAYPLQMPQLDIHTIGAGGGSIVHVQQDGTLEIGPQSAGAEPGPACYGRGGIEPTVSDANLLMGRLPTDRTLSGGLILDRGGAEAAFQTVADALGVDDVVVLADSALRIAVAKMAGAVREVSVHRGFDPRDFALVGFGGAGPMHVFLVADELAIPKVVIPRFPGHLSALGQMLADMRCDFVSAWGGRLSSLSVAALTAEIDTLVTRASAALTADGIPAERHRHTVNLDMRYVGQSFTLPILWSGGHVDWAPLRAAFDARHAETFGYEDQANDAEIVNIRLVSIGVVEKPVIGMAEIADDDPVLERRPVWFGDWVECPVYRRDAMPPGFTVIGPAVVEESGGTSVVPPLWHCEVAVDGALVCARDD